MVCGDEQKQPLLSRHAINRVQQARERLSGSPPQAPPGAAALALNECGITVLEKKAAAWRGRGERLGEVVVG